MDSEFSHEEKRFVLAEIIRASSTSLEDMVLFIKHHQIEPDWLNMRVPNGRTINQCNQVAERLAIHTPSLKRKSISSPPHQPSKRRATSTAVVDQPGSPPKNHRFPSPIPPLLPRPAENSLAEAPPEQAPKKRGRPSRADKAKRNLHPNLPQTIAPRPIQPAPNAQALNPERLLPAMSPTPSVRTATPPTAYRTSRGSMDSQAEHPMTRTPSSDVTTDRARPRILAEGFSEDFSRDGRPVLPSPFRDAARPHQVSHALASDHNMVSPKGLSSILNRPP